MSQWVSPHLRITFTPTVKAIELYYPNGRRFLSTVELMEQAEKEKQRAEQERQRAEQKQHRAERLEAQLRALGIKPESLGC